MNTTEITTSDDIPESEPSEPPQPELIEDSSIRQHNDCVQLLDKTQNSHYPGIRNMRLQTKHYGQYL